MKEQSANEKRFSPHRKTRAAVFMVRLIENNFITAHKTDFGSDTAIVHLICNTAFSVRLLAAFSAWVG